jgi:hypothetical protein
VLGKMPKVTNPIKPRTFNDVATYKSMSGLTYKIIDYLLENNNVIWNLLYYNENSALYKPALTLDKKRSMIYNGDTSLDATQKFQQYKIFQQDFVDDASEVQQSRLYIHVLGIRPNTSYTGQIDIGFEVIVNNSLSVLNTYENRAELLVDELLGSLNGANISGLTNIEFSKNNNNHAIAVRYDTKWYSGFRLVMSCKMG